MALTTITQIAQQYGIDYRTLKKYVNQADPHLLNTLKQQRRRLLNSAEIARIKGIMEDPYIYAGKSAK